MPTQTPADTHPDLYSPVTEIETPALLVDLEIMEDNIDQYVSVAERNDVRLRSHTKTHKIPEISHRQHTKSDRGGIVCQKLGEAEVMAASGIDDIYLSYQVVGDRKLDRLIHLSNIIDKFATTVDGVGNIRPLQAAAERHDTTVSVILEINIGYDRTGVMSGKPALNLAKEIESQSNLEFAGIMAYEAHVKSDADTEEEYEKLCYSAMETTAETVELIESAGIPVSEVKVGGTSTSPYSSRHPIVTEINPGQYVFNDVGEIEARPWAVEKKDCALTVLSTVISTQVDGKVIVDAGSKSLSMDTSQNPVSKDRSDLTYAGYSEEHGHIDTSNCEKQYRVGDRLEFIAPHVCPTINLHETLIGVRDGYVEEIWDIQARGKVR